MANKSIELYKNSEDPIDRILGSLIYGEDKVMLSSAEERLLKDAEIAMMKIEENNGNERIAIAQMMQAPGDSAMSRTRAYQACRNAQRFFSYIQNFDFFFELLVKKNRLESMIKSAKALQDFRSAASLEKEHTEILKEMRLEQERRAPDEVQMPKFLLHTDYRELGITEEAMTAARTRAAEIFAMVKKKTKGIIDAETVEFTEV